jgi:hypothetical protein
MAGMNPQLQAISRIVWISGRRYQIPGVRVFLVKG